jgi:ethanolamine ammonia-lyase large subunit
MLDEARAVGAEFNRIAGKTACTLKPGKVCALRWR